MACQWPRATERAAGGDEGPETGAESRDGVETWFRQVAEAAIEPRRTACLRAFESLPCEERHRMVRILAVLGAGRAMAAQSWLLQLLLSGWFHVRGRVELCGLLEGLELAARLTPDHLPAAVAAIALDSVLP